MGYVVFSAAVVVILAAATGLLQLLIRAVAIAIQLVIWAFWAVAGGLSILWLAITDRPTLARIWRKSPPHRGRQSPLGYRSAMRPTAQLQRSRRAF